MKDTDAEKWDATEKSSFIKTKHNTDKKKKYESEYNESKKPSSIRSSSPGATQQHIARKKGRVKK